MDLKVVTENIYPPIPSRAPQPDTVTEEMVEAALCAYSIVIPPLPFTDREKMGMRAALTAALAARGKVG